MTKFRFLILALFALSTFVFVFGKAGDFQVVSATKQSWSGGRPGSPGGVNYSFKIVAKKPSSKLTIDQLWVGKKKLEISQVIMMGAAEAGSFEKNDTIYFRASEKLGSLTERLAGKESEASMESAPPIEYEGVALIGYKTGKKVKYLPIEKFEVLKSASMP